jgi:Tol biopolymer transport system component
MRRTAWAALASMFFASWAVVAAVGRTDVKGAAAVSSRRGESEIAAVRLGTGNPPVAGIVMMDPSGRRRHVLERATGQNGVRVVPAHLAWSPGGNWLAFTGVVGRNAGRVDESATDLFVVRADGSGLRRVTHTGSASAPVWSPDGRTIVFSERSRGVGDPNLITEVAAPLMRVNRDGTDLRALTPLVLGQEDIPGSISPDGTQLLFTRFNLSALAVSGHVESSIQAISPDGAGLRELAAAGSDPTYSPDGRRIAFVSNRDRDGIIRTGEDESEYANDLYVMNSDGTGAARLTHSSELSELEPTWSPDGTRIAFTRQAEGFTKTIAVINANGSCGHQIAGDPTGAVWYSQPSWRPAARRALEGAMHCSNAGRRARRPAR